MEDIYQRWDILISQNQEALERLYSVLQTTRSLLERRHALVQQQRLLVQQRQALLDKRQALLLAMPQSRERFSRFHWDR